MIDCSGDGFRGINSDEKDSSNLLSQNREMEELATKTEPTQAKTYKSALKVLEENKSVSRENSSWN